MAWFPSAVTPEVPDDAANGEDQRGSNQEETTARPGDEFAGHLVAAQRFGQILRRAHLTLSLKNRNGHGALPIDRDAG